MSPVIQPLLVFTETVTNNKNGMVDVLHTVGAARETTKVQMGRPAGRRGAHGRGCCRLIGGPKYPHYSEAGQPGDSATHLSASGNGNSVDLSSRKVCGSAVEC